MLDVTVQNTTTLIVQQKQTHTIIISIVCPLLQVRNESRLTNPNRILLLNNPLWQRNTEVSCCNIHISALQSHSDKLNTAMLPLLQLTRGTSLVTTSVTAAALAASPSARRVQDRGARTSVACRSGPRVPRR